MQRLQTLMALALLLGVSFIAAPEAGAGHTMGGGTCWKPGTLTLCRVNWVYGQWMPLPLIDLFSYQAPSWSEYSDAAVSNWNAAVGPQVLQWAPAPDGTWVYLKYAWTNYPASGLDPGEYATTWNRDSSYCHNTPVATNIVWSDVYFNRDKYPGTLSTANRIFVFAHEIGHTLGLGHHSSSIRLMNSFPNGVMGPADPYDIGYQPPCGAANPNYWGLRCIYQWPWN